VTRALRIRLEATGGKNRESSRTQSADSASSAVSLDRHATYLVDAYLAGAVR
jgi:hypothetical protein